ncbi:MAG: peptidylprolyl isomerase [Gammaproteobacteria bacterium]|nr:peptidylprolyl isomerase [Gammaproteobacteria bacterium]
MITLETNFGAIKIELDFENTPNTAKNFLTHAKNGFYNDTIFHRVISGFMIQGGGFDGNMGHKPAGKNIQNEANQSQPNKRGTLAMARTSDPHSASTQFFINVEDNSFLNFTAESTSGWGYCVFGKVVEGMDIVDQIQKVPTTSKAGHQDVPASPVIIENVIVTDDVEA